jgi:mRNA interferase RelE/StbE
MAYRLLFRASFRKDLKRLPRDVAGRIAARIDELADNPFPVGVKKLQGHEQLYRIRVGDYRIVYAVDTQMHVVALTYVRHRKDVYRKL